LAAGKAAEAEVGASPSSLQSDFPDPPTMNTGATAEHTVPRPLFTTNEVLYLAIVVVMFVLIMVMVIPHESEKCASNFGPCLF